MSFNESNQWIKRENVETIPLFSCHIFFSFIGIFFLCDPQFKTSKDVTFVTKMFQRIKCIFN